MCVCVCVFYLDTINGMTWGVFLDLFVYFSGTPGVSPSAQATTPYEFYQLFVAHEVLQMLFEQTNLYFDQCDAAAPRPFTRYLVFLQWKPVTVTETKVLIALLMAMGIVVKSEVRSYWSTDPVLDTQ